MTVARIVRLALGWLALQGLQLGFWALLAPRSFYDNFPGLGRSWISVDGPFNEHFIRDFGALNLALAVLLIAAAVRLSRELVAVAAIATLMWNGPHLLYHLFNTDGLTNGDIAFSIGGLILAAVLSGLLLWSVRHLEDSTADQRPVLI